MIEQQPLSGLASRQLADFARSFLLHVERAGYRVVVTSVRRSRTKQVQLWQACMRGESRFPAAAPGSSPHELGIAFDIQLTPPGGGLPEAEIFKHYRPVGELWERIGLRWGGRFRDSIHFDFYPRGFKPPGDPRSCPGPRS